jgi:TM2 domain-containing membrane protein YozV
LFQAFRIVLFIGFYLFVSGYCFSQAVPDTSMKHIIPDSAITKQDEVKSLPNAGENATYSPTPHQTNAKKSGLYSAILPGAGQLYNKQYWKIPLIYAGAGVATYFFIDNQRNYRKYRRAYISRLDNDVTNDEQTNYSLQEVKVLQDQYKRWLDMTGLFTALGYTLQIMDAVVFAHLKDFDISRDISMRMQPVMYPNGGAGLGLAFHLK